MRLASTACLFAGCGINVLRAELFTTLKTPGFTATGTDHKSSTACLKPAGKNIITRSVLQTPPFAPRALFRIR